MKYVTLENHSYIGYVYNYMEGDRLVKAYEWKPIKGKIVDKKTMPEEHFLNLLQVGNAVQSGRLVIVDDENKEEAMEAFETEEYEKNAITREEAINMLNGTVANLKKVLAEITNPSTLQFIADVCKAEKIDSVSKQKAIAQALNKATDVVFGDDEQ